MIARGPARRVGLGVGLVALLCVAPRCDVHAAGRPQPWFDWQAAGECAPPTAETSGRAASEAAGADSLAPNEAGTEAPGGPSTRAVASALRTLIRPASSDLDTPELAAAADIGLRIGLSRVMWTGLSARYATAAQAQALGDCPTSTAGLRCLGRLAHAAGFGTVLSPRLVSRRRALTGVELRLLHVATAAVAREAFVPLAPDAPLGAVEAATEEAAVRVFGGLDRASDPEAPPEDVFVGMLPIPKTTFFLGSDRGEADEGPAVALTLAPYWIDRTEVTLEAWQACVGRGQCEELGLPLEPVAAALCARLPAAEPTLPVQCVSWTEARSYCRTQGKSLPSEARWELAARGTATRRFPWGELWPPPVDGPNLADSAAAALLPGWPLVPDYSDGHATFSPAGSQAQDLGFFAALDQGGNVAEWTLDCYSARAYATLTGSNPFAKGGAACTLRVARGGSWYQSDPEYLRAANRRPALPDARTPQVGFRCACRDRSGS